MTIELVGICSLYIILIFILFRTNTYFKKKNNLKEYEINVNANIGAYLPLILDEVIKECFNEYFVLNIGFKDKDYIDAEKEDEMAKEISALVMQRLSPAMITQLSLYYNINIIPNIVSNKVYLFMIDYVVKENRIDMK